MTLDPEGYALEFEQCSETERKDTERQSCKILLIRQYNVRLKRSRKWNQNLKVAKPQL